LNTLNIIRATEFVLKMFKNVSSRTTQRKTNLLKFLQLRTGMNKCYILACYLKQFHSITFFLKINFNLLFISLKPLIYLIQHNHKILKFLNNVSNINLDDLYCFIVPQLRKTFGYNKSYWGMFPSWIINMDISIFMLYLLTKKNIITTLWDLFLDIVINFPGL
jgi:hypothetical protein